jgi:hypothetical protein
MAIRDDDGLPRISIVTPTYNGARFLGHAMHSVLAQAYPNLEYIVIDGGSTDGSREMIEREAARLAHWVSEPDQGHAHALNKGFARSTGEIMGWLNGDDLYPAWSLRTVAEIFAAHPEVQWITGVNAWWDAAGRMTAARENLKNKYDYLAGRYAWIQQESTFWRRSLWDAAGGRLDEGYRYMVDGELWTRFFLHAPLHHVDCVLGGFRSWGENRSTQHLDECHEEMRRAIEVMRGHCDTHTLRVARMIQAATRVAERARGAPVRPLARRLLAPLLREAAYPCLRQEADGWRVETVPFAI